MIKLFGGAGWIEGMFVHIKPGLVSCSVCSSYGV